MKKLLLIAALASLSTPAFATKARLNALGNADHLVDTQTVFDNPSHMALMGDYVTFEAGATSPASTVVPGTTTWAEYENGITANPGAEGGFTRSMGDAKYGFYMGRRSAFTDSVRRGFGFLQQENPIELQYAQKGAMNWGAALNYSSSDKKTTQQKQQAMGLRFGASTEQWDAFAVVGLGSTADGNTTSAVVGSNDADADGIIDAAELTVITADATSKYKGTTGFKVGAAYNMDNLRLFGKFYMDGMKYESSNATNTAAGLNDVKVEASQFDLGVIDHNKIDGGQWFYGVSLQNYTSKTALTAAEVKTTAMYMPFLAGFEYDAASWLTVRASATQNVLLGSRKVDDGAISTMNDEANTIRNNTKVAAGLGLKFGKWVADGSWAASTTGNINTTNFMTNLGMTYMF
jgi:hypothetical protein